MAHEMGLGEASFAPPLRYLETVQRRAGVPEQIGLIEAVADHLAIGNGDRTR
jgi:hypothetical protein